MKKVHSLSQIADSVKNQYPWLNQRTIAKKKKREESLASIVKVPTRHIFSRLSAKSKVAPSSLQRRAKNVKKNEDCPCKERRCQETAICPLPRPWIFAALDIELSLDKVEKRLVGTHVTVVHGPCASIQTLPSVLRKKKSVHHPGLTPEPPKQQDLKTLQDPARPSKTLQDPARPSKI